MGLDPNYPSVEVNDASTWVTIYDDDHNAVGRLGGSRLRTNVRCLIRKWDHAWFYRQLSTAGNDIPSRNAYIPADQVHVFSNPYDPNPVPECQNLSGCFRKASAGVGTIGTLGAMALAVRRWQKRRR